MNIPRFMRLKRRVALYVCLLLLTLAGLSSSAAAQTCDTCPPPGEQGISWEADTPVTVNINPYFTEEQRGAIRAAFNNWQNSSNNTTGVTFTFTYNSTPASGANTHQVNYQTPNDQPTQAETFHFPTSDNSHLQRAVTNIDPRVTNLDAMTEAMAHEIGHTMGLDDCATCCDGVTVMTGFDPNNYNDTDSGRPDPGPCDTATANQTLGTAISNPTGGGGGGGGGLDEGGGGGGGYPCTPYYWYYYESWDDGESWDLVDISYAGCW
jgi:hypothetical protein